VDYGLEDFDFGVFGGRGFGQVLGEDKEVGVVAPFVLALFGFGKFGVGGAGGVGAEALLEGDLFLGFPAILRAAVGEFAGDAGVQAAERADGLNGVIGAEGQMDIVFEHGVPGVGAVDAIGAEA